MRWMEGSSAWARMACGVQQSVSDGKLKWRGGKKGRTYLFAEDGVVVLVSPELESRLRVKRRVERDEDGAVRGHVEVLELVHPVCQVELEMGASVRGVRSGKMELTRSRTRMSGWHRGRC